MKAIIKWLFGLTAACCVGGCLGLNTAAAVAETDKSNAISATVAEINNERLDNGIAFVMVLSASDYMTADGWSNTNYKWLNAEEVSDRSNINTSANNVANAQLDKNLVEYNFEDYITVDGVSLAEFSQTNSYKLIANKRTRPNTFSIDFAPSVLDGVRLVEIKAGCQIPTLSYSYFGAGEFSYIEIEESVTYEKRDGKWVEYFEGYEEGVEYAGTEDNFNLTLNTQFKGHTAVPLNAYTDFFMANAVQGEYLKDKVLVSAANTEKDNLMVLSFVNPIDAQQFNRLHLRVYINHQVDVLTYNADSITEETLGPALESYTVGGGQHFYLTLNSALYAGDDGKVSQIVFKFAQDCEIQRNGNGEPIYDPAGWVIRDTFHFVSFHVEQAEEGALVKEDSFMVVDSGEAYALTFRFNKSGGNREGDLDLSKVSLNGVLLSDVLAECEEATAEWYLAKGIYQINVTIPKAYAGKAKIKNAEYNFAGNNMSVLEGLRFPNGDLLEKTYTCHLYAGENLMDTEFVESYQAIEVERVRFSFIEDSQNLNFSIYFSGAITTSLYNHACEKEAWRSSENIGYDEGSSEIFLSGGYKASLLDNVVINGRSIGEWHAQDAAALTNVQVHYGAGAELNRMDIRFESASKYTYNQLFDLVSDGNGVTIEVLSGLKFMTNNAMKKTQVFAMVDGEFTLQAEESEIHVYYDGLEVQNGQEVTVKTAVSDASIAVEGASDYKVTREDANGKKVYTIAYGDGKTFTFTVSEDVVAAEEENGGLFGCVSSVSAYSVVTLLAACAALVLTMKGGKKHEEQ